MWFGNNILKVSANITLEAYFSTKAENKKTEQE